MMKELHLGVVSDRRGATAGRRRSDVGPLDFLTSGGELGAIMLAHDWSDSSLGGPETWTQPLRTAVRFMLNTRHPMQIFWGEDAAFLYNDAFRASIRPEYEPTLLGRPAREAWGELWDTVSWRIDQLMTGGAPTWHENQLVPTLRNGRLQDVYWTYGYAPIDDTASPTGIGGVLVVCNETTGTVLAEQERAAQAERWEQLFRQAPGFMAVLEGPEHRLTFGNPAYFRVIGDRDILGRTVAEALPEAVAQGYLDLLDQVFRTGQAFSSRGRKFAREASPGGPIDERYVDFVYQPITDASGTVTGVLVDGFDSTERTLAETALRESEARLREMNGKLEQLVAERSAALKESEAWARSVFETSYVLQGVTALDGILLDANATALAAIGKRAEEVVGRLLWETPWFSDAPGVPEFVQSAIAAAARGEIVQHEMSILLPKGMRIFDFSMRPIRSQEGTVIAVVGEGIDITDRRLAEESLRQSHKLEAMGQLTGGVAHDFNNLLTPIIGSLDMLIRGDFGGTRERRLIDAAMKSAERARTLVQRLLAFARRQPLQIDAVDIAGLVSGMVGLLASTLGPHIKVTLELADDLPSAKGDHNQLEMAILNLGVNARDAMPEGGSLRIAATVESLHVGHPSKLAPGRYVRVSVADTGCGMDETTVARAIEPFFSTKGVGQGTGLGLSMVHGLTAQLGGALTIASVQGVGTTIELWLPVTSDAVPVTKQLTKVGQAPTLGTVLLVDDEELVRMTAADMLTDLGFAVLEAMSGETALRIIESGAPIDVLITDHLMPGMTGVELAQAVQVLRPELPALIISGFADVQGLAADFPLLTKPFRLRDLGGMLAYLRGQETKRPRW